MATQREFDGQAGMEIGVGFDAVAGEVRGDCVVRTEPEGVGGDEIFFAIDLISTRQELMRRMNISASASLKVAIGSGSSKARYFSEQNVHRYSIYIVVTCVVQHTSRRMRDVELNTQARQLLEAGNIEGFRRRCGDEFLVGLTTGGEFYGIYELQTRSADEQREAEFSIRGSGAIGMYSASGSAGFEDAMRKLSERFNMRFRMFSVGGTPNSLPITAAELIEYARTFPQLVRGDGSKKYVATFLDYDTLDLPAGPNPIDVQNQKDIIDRLAIQRLQYLDVISSIEYVLGNPLQFELFDSQSLNAKVNELRDAVNRIVQASSRCMNDFRQCELLTDLPDPAVRLPERKDATCIGAINLAMQAADRAAAHATACEGFTRRILEISREIKTGSSGVRLADEAATKLKDATEAKKQSTRAVEDAITTTGVCAGTDEFIAAAKRSAARAAEDLELATKKYNETIFPVGYSPYWHAPRRIVFREICNYVGGLFWDGGITFGYNEESGPHGRVLLDKYCKDPKGGKLTAEQACERPEPCGFLGGTLCPIAGQAFASDSQGVMGVSIGSGGIATRYDPNKAFSLWFSFGVNSDLLNSPVKASVVLRSAATGLRTLVEFDLVFAQGPVVFDEYIHGDGEKRGQVFHNTESFEPESLQHAFTDDKALGWVSAPIA